MLTIILQCRSSIIYVNFTYPAFFNMLPFSGMNTMIVIIPLVLPPPRHPSFELVGLFL